MPSTRLARMASLADYVAPGFSILQARLDSVAAALDRVFLPEKRSNPPLERWERADIGRVYSGVPMRGGAQPATALLFEPVPSPEVTVVFSNAADGWMTLTNA